VPVTTTTKQYYSDALFGSLLVTVTRPATGATSWVYTDVLGQAVATTQWSFSGGLTNTRTTYDSLGRVVRTTAPYFTGQTQYATITHYDQYGRVDSVQKELGPIDGSSFPTTSTTTLTYAGSAITTR